MTLGRTETSASRVTWETADLIENIEFLAGLGLNWDAIEDRVGYLKSSMDHALRKGGKLDVIHRINRNTGG